jgi:hypothetical protein
MRPLAKEKPRAPWHRGVELYARRPDRMMSRQLLDLGCDHCEAPTGLSGPRGLDGGVEGEKIGLAGDRVDQRDDAADPLRRVREGLDSCGGALRPSHRLLSEVRRVAPKS